MSDTPLRPPRVVGLASGASLPLSNGVGIEIDGVLYDVMGTREVNVTYAAANRREVVLRLAVRPGRPVPGAQNKMQT